MRQRAPDPESYLEAGLIVFGGLILGGVATLLIGQSVNEIARARRHRRSAPAVGDIPAERHQNVASVSTR